MNLVTVIENVEIERDNNKKLGEAVLARLATMRAQTEALLTQAHEFTKQLNAQSNDIQKSIEVVSREFADRDAALAALIGGE